MLFSYSIDMITHMDILRSIKCHIEDSILFILGVQSGLLQSNSIKIINLQEKNMDIVMVLTHNRRRFNERI